MKKILIILLMLFSLNIFVQNINADDSTFVSQKKNYSYYEVLEEPKITTINSTGYKSIVEFNSLEKGYYLLLMLDKGEVVNVDDHLKYFDTDEITFNDLDYMLQAKNTRLPISTEYKDKVNLYFTSGTLEFKSDKVLDNNQYDIRLYKLISTDYFTSNKIDLESDVYSDLNLLGVNLSNAIYNYKVKIITFAIGNTIDNETGLYMYLFSPYENINMKNVSSKNTYRLDYYNIASNEVEIKSLDFSYRTSTGNIYKYLIDDDMLDELDNKDVVQYHLDSISSIDISGEINFELNYDNDNYHRQQVTIKKTVTNDGWIMYEFGALNDMVIKVVGDYHYKEYSSTDINFGFIGNTKPTYRLHYYTFDVYFNGEKIDFEKLITKVKLDYSIDYIMRASPNDRNWFESMLDWIQGNDYSMLPDRTYRESSTPMKNIVIEPSHQKFEYPHEIENFGDFWDTIFKLNSDNAKTDYYEFNTLIRSDQAKAAGYKDLNFDGHDYVLYLPSENGEYDTSIEKGGNVTLPASAFLFVPGGKPGDVDWSPAGNITCGTTYYHQISDIDVAEITYLEKGVTYSVKVDETTTTYHYDKSGGGVGTLVKDTYTFADFLKDAQEFLQWLIAQPWFWIVVVILVVALIVALVSGGGTVLSIILMITKWILVAFVYLCKFIKFIFKSIFNFIKWFFSLFKRKEKKKSKLPASKKPGTKK